jgi:hypothetical protein
MLLPFTNCGQYADPASEDLYSLDIDSCDDDCILPKPENLQIKPNVGTGNEYSVPVGLTEWNIGGDCNEGGYPYNLVRWELMLNGAVVRHSGMLGMAGSNAVNTRCVNGRFLLYINLAAIPEDNVNRSGLNTGVGTVRSAYDLYIEIYGQNVLNDPAPVRNPQKGRTRLSLSAI